MIIQNVTPDTCPRCKAPLKPGQQTCAVCGLPLDPSSIQAFYNWQASQQAGADSASQPQSFNSNPGGETTFYQTDNVLVTNSRAIIFGKTYALANITSVRKVTYPPNPARPLIIGGTGLVIALLSLPGLAAASSTAISFFIFGVILMVLALWLLRQLKPTFGVVLGSASAEHSIINNPDEIEIDRLVGAINQAIVHRG